MRVTWVRSGVALALASGAFAVQSTPANDTDPAGLFCAGDAATIADDDGSGIVDGTPRRDVIVAGGGDDRIHSRGGDDVICAGDGNDVAKGGNGSDRILGEAGKDNLKGGAGLDDCAGGPGKDELQSC